MTDPNALAIAHRYELGWRVAYMLHGYGENSAEERVRRAAVKGYATRAVGFDPTEGQMALELTA